jgi:hypothetical protein
MLRAFSMLVMLTLCCNARAAAREGEEVEPMDEEQTGAVDGQSPFGF